jgi:23S rRNA (cytidine1920-2'-O)/16S rRNA (cytidine1409-2'-O)-methyltransferase
LADRERLDRLLVEREIAESREKARAFILCGAVRVDGRRVDKAGALVPKDAEITLNREALPSGGKRFASRGGLKLDPALEAFGVEVAGRAAVDIGASTGGFTDCLLQRGASRVVAIDVGYGQLAWNLRKDPRVDVMERTNIRNLVAGPLAGAADLITIDVSFISLTKVLPKALELLKPDGRILALVKPQFEAGRGEVGRGGIVRDPARRLAAVEKIRAFARTLGLRNLGEMDSPLPGQDGNLEFFLLLGRS